MAKHKKPSGSFTVSGPFEKDHPVPNVGAGISCAQTFCTRHRKEADELTYYVRSLTGDLLAMIELRDGAIETRAHGAFLL
jgi:hypothetical protein